MTNREYMESLSDEELSYFLSRDNPPWEVYAKECRLKGNLDYYFYVKLWLRKEHQEKE